MHAPPHTGVPGGAQVAELPQSVALQHGPPLAPPAPPRPLLPPVAPPWPPVAPPVPCPPAPPCPPELWVEPQPIEKRATSPSPASDRILMRADSARHRLAGCPPHNTGIAQKEPSGI